MSQVPSAQLPIVAPAQASIGSVPGIGTAGVGEGLDRVGRALTRVEIRNQALDIQRDEQRKRRELEEYEISLAETFAKAEFDALNGPVGQETALFDQATASLESGVNGRFEDEFQREDARLILERYFARSRSSIHQQSFTREKNESNQTLKTQASRFLDGIEGGTRVANDDIAQFEESTQFRVSKGFMTPAQKEAADLAFSLDARKATDDRVINSLLSFRREAFEAISKEPNPAIRNALRDEYAARVRQAYEERRLTARQSADLISQADNTLDRSTQNRLSSILSTQADVAINPETSAEDMISATDDALDFIRGMGLSDAQEAAAIAQVHRYHGQRSNRDLQALESDLREDERQTALVVKSLISTAPYSERGPTLLDEASAQIESISDPEIRRSLELDLKRVRGQISRSQDGAFRVLRDMSEGRTIPHDTPAETIDAAYRDVVKSGGNAVGFVMDVMRQGFQAPKPFVERMKGLYGGPAADIQEANRLWTQMHSIDPDKAFTFARSISKTAYVQASMSLVADPVVAGVAGEMASNPEQFDSGLGFADNRINPKDDKGGPAQNLKVAVELTDKLDSVFSPSQKQLADAAFMLGYSGALRRGETDDNALDEAGVAFVDRALRAVYSPQEWNGKTHWMPRGMPVTQGTISSWDAGRRRHGGTFRIPVASPGSIRPLFSIPTPFGGATATVEPGAMFELNGSFYTPVVGPVGPVEYIQHRDGVPPVFIGPENRDEFMALQRRLETVVDPSKIVSNRDSRWLPEFGANAPLSLYPDRLQKINAMVTERWRATNGALPSSPEELQEFQTMAEREARSQGWTRFE